MTEPSDFTPYEPQRLPAVPPRPTGPGRLLGRAQTVQVRQERISEGVSMTVLSLRLSDTPDGRPADVELRGTSISGSVHDGDWVEIPDQRDKSGRYEPLSLSNLTTGAVVSVSGSLKSPGARAGRVVALVVLALVLVGFIVFGVAMFTVMSE